MRLIDADALEKLLTDMAKDAKSIRELQLNALCYAAIKSESMTPTIDAIPMWWITEKFLDVLNKDKELSKAVWLVRKAWQKEQEE